MASNLDLSRFKAMTFDCYGTLIDWEKGILSVLHPWAERHNLRANDEALLDAFSQNEHRCQRIAPLAPYPEILRTVHAGIASHFSVPVTPHEADALADSIRDWPSFDDSPSALLELKQRYKLLILSNIDRSSFAHSNTKLGVEFDVVITAEDVGSYKPSHGHFLRAFECLEEMGIARTELLHVAQSLFHDHEPGKALGLTTVWVNRRHGRDGWGATPPPPTAVKPDMVVNSLRDLAQQVSAGSE